MASESSIQTGFTLPNWVMVKLMLELSGGMAVLGIFSSVTDGGIRKSSVRMNRYRRSFRIHKFDFLILERFWLRVEISSFN